jgi:hypothetical protein
MSDLAPTDDQLVDHLLAASFGRESPSADRMRTAACRLASLSGWKQGADPALALGQARAEAERNARIVDQWRTRAHKLEADIRSLHGRLKERGRVRLWKRFVRMQTALLQIAAAVAHKATMSPANDTVAAIVDRALVREGFRDPEIGLRDVWAAADILRRKGWDVTPPPGALETGPNP